MHSSLVKMAPVFDRSIEGERVHFKKRTKKGKLIVEGTGRVQVVYGTRLIIESDDVENFFFDTVLIYAQDVWSGKCSIKLLPKS